MYIVKTPLFVQSLFKRLVWRIVDAKKIYLTFDDGPVPEATPWVLDQLRDAGVTATFFCVGENVQLYPEIYQRIIDEGHAIGNHTHNHLNAWKTDRKSYLENIDQASAYIASKMFRPPYGRLLPQLAREIEEKYDIIMWDILSGDFDSNITAEKCIDNVIQNSREGSIIVFHDSIKAIDKLKIVLPQVIAHFKSQGVEMTRIETVDHTRK